MRVGRQRRPEVELLPQTPGSCPDAGPQRLLNEEEDTFREGQDGPATGVAKCCLKGRTSIFFSLKSPRFYFQDAHRGTQRGVSLGKNREEAVRRDPAEGVILVTQAATGVTRPQSVHCCYM